MGTRRTSQKSGKPEREQSWARNNRVREIEKFKVYIARIMSWKLPMVPNVSRERVSYGITTTIGVNRSPKRERIFLQKIKFQKVGFLRENFVGRFQNQKYVQKSREQASYFEKFKNPCQKSSLGKLWVLVVRESREKSEFEIQKSSLMIQKSKCVQLCRVYRKPN